MNKKKMADLADNRNVFLLFMMAAAMGAALYFLWPLLYQNVFPDEAVTVYSHAMDSPRVVHADLDGSGVYQPTEGDPQIHLSFDQVRMVQSYCITFGEPLAEDTEIQLYYAGVDEAFSEKRVYKEIMKAGLSRFFCDLPAGECISIRTDINGPCVIENIRVSEDKTVPRMTWVVIPVVLVCILLVVSFSLFVYLGFVLDKKSFPERRKN